MINLISSKIAEYIVKNDQDSDYEILKYGYELLIYEVFSSLMVFLSSLILGVFLPMLLTAFLYTSLRLTIGGCHASSRLICFVTYTSSLYLCIVLSSHITLPYVVSIALFLISLINLLLYAPADTEELPIVKNRKLRKTAGIALLMFFALFSVIIRDYKFIANSCILVPFMTCLFVHPAVYKLFGCKRHNRKEMTTCVNQL